MSTKDKGDMSLGGAVPGHAERQSPVAATSKYFGSWSTHEECAKAWLDYSDKSAAPEGFPTDAEILFASYGGASYEGDAVVIFERDGKLYEAHGSHCSCYGLEGQWEPEETTVEALAIRQRKDDPAARGFHFLCEHDEEAVAAYWALIARIEGQQ